jgi:hypothetical protein
MQLKTLHSRWLCILGVLVLAYCGGHPPNAAAKQAARVTPRVAQAPAAGNAFYASPTGTPSGDGSRDAPWDLQTALGQPSSVHPGDTIWLRGGTYVGTFIATLNGTADRPIVVRQYPGEYATLDGASLANPAISVRGSYIWFWGFEVMSSDLRRQTTQSGSNPTDITRGDGFQIYQDSQGDPHPGLKFINLVVHDLRQGFSFWQEAVGGEISGCLVYYNGFTGPDRGHGHGIYTQNETGTKTIEGNVIFSGFGLGIQAYGSETAHLDNFLIQGNTLFNGGDLEPTGGSRNLLIGGSSIAHDPKILNNAFYRLYGGGGVETDFKLGYNAACQDPTIVGNYVATSVDINCTGMTIAGNTFYGTPINGITKNQFPDSLYLSSRPDAPDVIVQPNTYEPGRAHVTVYNWPHQDTVAVDLSGVLAVGADYEIRNAQNFFGPVVASGRYAGGPVAIPMSGLASAAPVGWTAPAVTGPEFNVFVVLTTQSSRPTPTLVNPPPGPRLSGPTRPPAGS